MFITVRNHNLKNHVKYSRKSVRRKAYVMREEDFTQAFSRSHFEGPLLLQYCESNPGFCTCFIEVT